MVLVEKDAGHVKMDPRRERSFREQRDDDGGAGSTCRKTVRQALHQGLETCRER